HTSWGRAPLGTENRAVFGTATLDPASPEQTLQALPLFSLESLPLFTLALGALLRFAQLPQLLQPGLGPGQRVGVGAWRPPVAAPVKGYGVTKKSGRPRSADFSFCWKRRLHGQPGTRSRRPCRPPPKRRSAIACRRRAAPSADDDGLVCAGDDGVDFPL